jgi:RimJ/RimL family protein N-acetyltransferase
LIPPSVILETHRATLRQFHPNDEAALVRVFDDAYARQFYPDMADKAGLWALCLRSTGELIGDCGLANQTVERATEVEIGYHLRADHRGRGLVTEAASACMHHGFITAGAARLVSMVHPENPASMGVARRIHQHTRRFERLGDLYHLFYTERTEWPIEAQRY